MQDKPSSSGEKQLWARWIETPGTGVMNPWKLPLENYTWEYKDLGNGVRELSIWVDNPPKSRKGDEVNE